LQFNPIYGRKGFGECFWILLLNVREVFTLSLSKNTYTLNFFLHQLNQTVIKWLEVFKFISPLDWKILPELHSMLLSFQKAFDKMDRLLPRTEHCDRWHSGWWILWDRMPIPEVSIWYLNKWSIVYRVITVEMGISSNSFSFFLDQSLVTEFRDVKSLCYLSDDRHSL